jgi:hypothetical protein
MRLLKKALLGATVAAAALSATPASALNIVLNDIGGVTGSQAELGFRIAAYYWESVFTNNATVRLDVGYSNLGPGVLGATGSEIIEFVPIQSYYNALGETGNSALDATALANLSPLSSTASIQMVVPGYKNNTLRTGIDNETSRLAPDGQPISSTIALLRANAKALGLVTGGTDAEINFSNTFAFDFDPTNGIAAGQYDFIGVAIHEIGHALGFVSGVDDFDYSGDYTGPVDNAWWGYGLDMFRYSANGGGLSNGPIIDLTPGTASYFSIDGGQSAFLNGFFSTGENFGDGNQASHWKAPGGCTDFLGILNPYICSGQVDSVTALDLALYDAIGWNVNFDILGNQGYEISTASIYRNFFGAAAVPEPASWAMMISGFGLIGSAMRRAKVRKVAFAAA